MSQSGFRREHWTNDSRVWGWTLPLSREKKHCLSHDFYFFLGTTTREAGHKRISLFSSHDFDWTRSPFLSINCWKWTKAINWCLFTVLPQEGDLTKPLLISFAVWKSKPMDWRNQPPYLSKASEPESASQKSALLLGKLWIARHINRAVCSSVSRSESLKFKSPCTMFIKCPFSYFKVSCLKQIFCPTKKSSPKGSFCPYE